MGSSMSHWERFRAALRGDAVDRVPISLWRHWPLEDGGAEGLARATLGWQEEHDFDLVKVTPAGTYGVEDWGAGTEYKPNRHGVRTVPRPGLTSFEEWPHLKPLEAKQGCLGRQLTALRQVVEGVGDSAPVLMTVFSPLTTAMKLAGSRVFADLRLQPEVFARGLSVIAETTARFSVACLQTGAHGIFFATQCATYRLLSEVEYRAFGEPYDRVVLEAARSHAEILLLHVHGEDIMFDLVASYPVDGMNWHDRTAGPSLREAGARFPGMLVGGINEWGALSEAAPAEIEGEIRQAIDQTAGLRFMVGPGCVVPIDTPAENLRAARKAVEG
ncbi:MAG TPA: uroporphyrinogen decarboxylase family protein [Anaerolineales bacterium]|nr:uroporphyrinogen decarboxylase family protein [Anaerolineales bacterium]